MNRSPGTAAAMCLAIAGVASFAGPTPPPKDAGLVEHVERRLFPLTVRIRALTPQDRATAAHLVKSDFVVFVNLKKIAPEQIELDDYCSELPERDATAQPEPSKHLLLFTDQMGLEGQVNTSAMLQNMIPRLVADGYQLRLVPGGDPEWSNDPDRLLRDAGRLFDPSNPSTGTRDVPLADRIAVLLRSRRVDQALAVAREADRATQLSFEGPELQLSRVLSDMTELPMPKAMVYFADSAYSSHEFVVDWAIRSGVPVYAVLATGLPTHDPNVSLAHDLGSLTTTSLLSLSTHTGGKFSWGHFRKGASDKVLERVRTGLSCVYVLNIDAGALDPDRTLRPRVELRTDLQRRVSVETIPDFTIPSEARQREDAASIAFRSAEWPGLQPAGVSVVPLESDGSGVKALIQLSVDSEPGAPSIAATWDVGVNFAGEPRVSGYGAIEAKTRSPKIVFEKTVSLPIGPYWVVGIGQEVGGHGMARGTDVGTFKKPGRRAVEFLHPVDVMQWSPGAFVSEDKPARAADWISLPYAMAASDRPVSFVTSLCRGKSVTGLLTIEKTLQLPDTLVRFSRTEWPIGRTAPCLVVRDVPPGSDPLPWSDQPYEATFAVTVHNASGEAVAATSESFWVIGPRR